jgi:hypothetical protein
MNAVLVKRITYDGILMGIKGAIIFVNNDGKAAFDRMVPLIGRIALCRLGADIQAVQTLLLTLEHITYSIKTSLKLSKASYSKLQVELQGDYLHHGFQLHIYCWGHIRNSLEG